MSRGTTRTGTKRLALDSNLMILWVTGLNNRLDVGRTKRTKGYGPEEFDQLDGLLSQYVGDPLKRIVVTPNIVTECSNLLDDSRSRDGRSPRGQVLKQLIDTGAISVEEYVPSKQAMSREEYRYLGVADCSLLSLVDDTTALLTDDTKLVYEAKAINPESRSFGQIRWDIHRGTR